MNIGPPEPCKFCGLVLESANHLFCHCHISVRICKMVESVANIKTNLLDLLVNGQWLDFHSHDNSKFVASLIAATLW